MNKRALLMDKNDNVATVIDAVVAGDSVDIILNGEKIETISSLDDIDHYHKLATLQIEKDTDVYKYGEIIGKSTQAISKGEHVHVNNIESVMTV